MEPELATTAATAATSFPVKFHDGGRDLELGSVTIYPSMSFKRFQVAIVQKVGLAPHQISTSLVRRKKGTKIPIDEASDFTAIAREKDAFVLVSHRRPRRKRRSRTWRENRLDDVGYEDDAKKSAAAMFPERMILRRNPGAGFGGLDPPAAIGGLMTDAAVVSLGMWDYESQMRNLQRQRERFLMSAAAASPYYPYLEAAKDSGYLLQAEAAAAAKDASAFGGPGSRPGMPVPLGDPPTCWECEAAKEEGRAPAFHSCVFDAVTVGFRSPAGPIQRPPKKQVEASA